MKTVLVPIDFSKPSLYALHAAADIALKAKSLLIVLHVIEEPTGPFYTIDGEYIPEGYENRLFTLLLLKNRKEEFNKLKASDFLKDVDIRFELKVASPFDGVTDIILGYQVDLMVIGTSGHTKDEIFGSIINKVIRHARCPVLTVHRPPVANDYKSIVYATRAFADEKLFSRIVKTAQALYQSTVHLVRINTPSNFLPDHEAKKILHEYAALHHLKDFTINVYSDLTEEDGIIRFAEIINANMIAIATHGRSGLMHMLSGSISKEVVNHSSRPVMTFLVEQ